MPGPLASSVPCHPCSKTELDLTSVPPTQVAIVDDYVVSTGTKSSLDGTGPLEFEITASGEDYLDLSQCYLKLKVQVLNENGSYLNSYHADAGEGDTPADEPGPQHSVVPVNLMLHSLFRQVEFSMNDTLVTSSNDTYPYRAYLETLLSYGAEAKKCWLKHLEGWTWDDDGEYDLDTNRAIWVKNKRYGKSKVVDLKGRLRVDMCMQGRLIPNNVTVKFVLTRSKPEFCVNSFETGKTYKVKIESATLEARRVKLAAQEQLRLERAIAASGARYPVTHVLTKSFTVSSGLNSVTLDSLFSGQIPNKVMLAMVRNDAFNGAYNKNPFNLQHFNINMACLYVDGRQVPSMGLEANFKRGQFSDMYFELLKNLGFYPHDWGNSLTDLQFKGGSFVLLYDLTPDEAGDGVDFVTTRRHGTVKASLRFDDPLETTVTVIALGQFDNTVVIDKNRSVVFDYTA